MKLRNRLIEKLILCVSYCIAYLIATIFWYGFGKWDTQKDSK